MALIQAYHRPRILDLQALSYWSKKPKNPTDFAYVCNKATSSAIDHLKDVHKLGKHGAIREERA
jgi:hypothetical protein